VSGKSRNNERKRTIDEASKTEGDVKTGEYWLLRDKRWRNLLCCQRGIRRLGGVSPIQARTWNLGTCRLDAKEEVQVVAPQGPEYRCEAQGRNGL